jgi:hypothetical protein
MGSPMTMIISPLRKGLFFHKGYPNTAGNKKFFLGNRKNRIILSFLKNETRITECLQIMSFLDTGGLVFNVVQRLPSGKPGTAPKEWD